MPDNLSYTDRDDYNAILQKLEKHNSTLETLIVLLDQQNREQSPIDHDEQISASQAYVVDYKNRKHVYIWSPTTIQLSVEDFGTGTIQPQVWLNIGVPQGTRITAPSVTGTTTYIKVRCTNELIA